MSRTGIYLLAGVILGGIIHIAVILTLPLLATQTVWDRVSALGDLGRTIVIGPALAGAPNPLGLDPELTYAVCRLDLAAGPGEVSGSLPQAFWSVAVYDRRGGVLYSTTNRDGIGQQLDLGIFNPAQTRLLARQQLSVAEGLLIVESPADQVFVVVKLAPPHRIMRSRYEAALSELVCGNIT